ncbi:MAG: c-type cytochrome, partial [Planctomycetota bacterium]|nr:c-type cytochrome [Planctomycetota bacterium]
RMAALPKRKRELAGTLWHQFRQAHPDRKNDGQFFVKIIDYVINNDALVKRRFVKKWQHQWFGPVADNLKGRSVENGKRIFEQATCSRCHSVDGKAVSNGPDLSAIATRFKGQKLLRQVVQPSAEINKEYQTQMIETDEGKLYTGLVIEETNEQIKMLTNLLKPDKVTLIPKTTIEGRKTAELSTMPVGLLDTYQQDELLDLLAYLQTLDGKQESRSQGKRK